MWKKVEKAFEVKKTTTVAVLPHNPALIAPVKKPSHYEDFWRCYEKSGYKKLLKRYTYYGFVYRTLARIKKKIIGVFR